MKALLRLKHIPQDAAKKVTTTISLSSVSLQLAKAEAIRRGISFSALVEKLVAEDLDQRAMADFPAQPVERPAETGWWWWRPDGLASWQVLEVRAEGDSLYVLCDDRNLYQCDDDPNDAWYGEWWPVKLQPPAK